MNLRILGLIMTVTACTDKDDSANAGDGEGDADTDADSDADSDTDTDTDTDIYFDGKGTYDGAGFEVHCDETTIVTVKAKATGILSVNAQCSATTGSMIRVMVFAHNPAVGKSTTCDDDLSVAVIDDNTGTYYACGEGGVTEFTMNLTESESLGTAGHLWGGDFELVGKGGGHAADVSGSFRAISL